jgi:glutamyl-tRNA reductase
VEPSVNDLENAFCYDIDDLRSVVEANLKERQREALRAQALLEGEVVKFAGRLRQLEVVPTIVSLREKLEAIRRAELERALGRLPGAGEETRRVMEALSQAIVNKVLHAPMVKLKDSSRAGHARRWTEMISELFGLRGPGRPDSRE